MEYTNRIMEKGDNKENFVYFWGILEIYGLFVRIGNNKNQRIISKEKFVRKPSYIIYKTKIGRWLERFN